MAADSVGLAIPKNMLPKTATIKTVGGMIESRAFFIISFLGLSLFIAGAADGFMKDTIKIYKI